MPFYEYECANCKFYTEVMQKISDAPLKKCPSCSKLKLKKLVSDLVRELSSTLAAVLKLLPLTGRASNPPTTIPIFTADTLP